MKQLIILTFVTMFFSCTSKLLVHKENIIYHKKGYLAFYYQRWEAFFFPWKDTVDNTFLKSSHLNGYKIDQYDVKYLKEMAKANIVQQSIFQNGKSILVSDSIKLLPVTISYYWGDKWNTSRNMSEKINIKYVYQGMQFDLFYKLYDERYILSIKPLKSHKDLR